MFLSPIDRSLLTQKQAQAESDGKPVTIPADVFLNLLALKDDLVRQRDRAVENQRRWLEAAEIERERAMSLEVEVVSLKETISGIVGKRS